MGAKIRKNRCVTAIIIAQIFSQKTLRTSVSLGLFHLVNNMIIAFSLCQLGSTGRDTINGSRRCHAKSLSEKQDNRRRREYKQNV